MYFIVHDRNMKALTFYVYTFSIAGFINMIILNPNVFAIIRKVCSGIGTTSYINTFSPFGIILACVVYFVS